MALKSTQQKQDLHFPNILRTKHNQISFAAVNERSFWKPNREINKAKKTNSSTHDQNIVNNENFPKTLAICSDPNPKFALKEWKARSQQGKSSWVCLCYLGGIDVSAVRRIVVGIVLLVVRIKDVTGTQIKAVGTTVAATRR